MDNPKIKTRVRTNRRGVTKTVTKTKDVSPTGTKTRTRTVSRTQNLSGKSLGTVGSTGDLAKSGTKSLVKQKTIAKSASGDKVRVKSVTGSLSKRGERWGSEGVPSTYDVRATATKEKSSQPGLKRNQKTGSVYSNYNNNSPVTKNTTFKEARSIARKLRK